MHHSTAFRAVLLTVLGLAVTFSATAQWQWVDKDGRRVYSDRSPPADIPEKNILKQPAGAKRIATEPAPEATAAQTPPTAKMATPSAGYIPKVTGKDPLLIEKKKQAEEAEAAKKKAEEERVAKIKAENCVRAKQGLATFDSGVRVSVTNAKGEREIMDDAARAAEVKRLQGIVAAECV